MVEAREDCEEEETEEEEHPLDNARRGIDELRRHRGGENTAQEEAEQRTENVGDRVAGVKAVLEFGTEEV
jgi:hypothetical protein